VKFTHFATLLAIVFHKVTPYGHNKILNYKQEVFMKFLSSAFLLLFLINTSNTAFAFTPIDASNFDIAGVKLGMNEGEAFDAIKKSLNINDGQLQFGTFTNVMRRPDLRQRSVNVILGKYFYSIDFKTDVYNKTQERIVTSVSVSINEPVPSTEQKEVFYDSVVAKYGNPSKGRAKYNAVYCLKNGCSAHPQHYLNYSGGRLSLNDGLWWSVAKKPIKKPIIKAPTL